MADLAQDKAYRAGYACAMTIQWPPEVADDKRHPGPHHCPFAEGDPQRDAWLRGLRDGWRRLEEQQKARKAALAQLEKELD